MYIQASLMFICSLNVCTCGAMSATAFVMKNRSGDVIAVVAIVLLLAGTRILVVMVSRMYSLYRQHLCLR